MLLKIKVLHKKDQYLLYKIEPHAKIYLFIFFFRTKNNNTKNLSEIHIIKQIPNKHIHLIKKICLIRFKNSNKEAIKNNNKCKMILEIKHHNINKK